VEVCHSSIRHFFPVNPRLSSNKMSNFPKPVLVISNNPCFLNQIHLVPSWYSLYVSLKCVVFQFSRVGNVILVWKRGGLYIVDERAENAIVISTKQLNKQASSHCKIIKQQRDNKWQRILEITNVTTE
jgi:hypothetical protein